jgi:hypothetical protein
MADGGNQPAVKLLALDGRGFLQRRNTALKQSC